MPWVSSRRVVNPEANAVLADSGALTGNVRKWFVVASANVAALFEVQHVAADGTTVLKSQIIGVSAFGTQFTPPFDIEYGFFMLDNERIRVIAVAAIVGQTSVSLFHSE